MGKFKQFLQIQKAKAGIEVIKRAPMNSQLKFLQDAMDKGLVTETAVQKVIMNEAPKEMHKGTERLLKEGKPVTIDALMEDYRNQPDFRSLADRLGLKEDYFLGLAKAEVESNNGQKQ